MGKNRFAHQQNKGFKTPQEGPVQRNASTVADMTAGRAPETSHAGYPGISKLRAGTPPKDTGATRSAPEKVTGGTGPKNPSGMLHGTSHDIKGGAAPVAGMSKPGAGKAPSDVDNQRAQTGRNGYAKGGKVKSEERNESAKEKAREVKAGDAYAKGGKVNRHGVENKVAPQPTMTGNAVPLGQPGGAPSTGITAGGTLPMTSDTMGQESTVAVPKLRSTALKRSGAAPSLPRPRR